MRKRIALLLMLGMMPWSGLHSQTQTATTTFLVKTTVQAVCGVTATDLNFGNYSSGGSPLLGQTNLQATCTPGTTYNIALNAGVGGGTIYGGRQMASGPTNKLNYQLYRDSARANIWGNTIGTDTVQDVGNGLPKSHDVFGTIPGAQAVPAGAYQDTITVTISF